jgi:tetratricopeptide (TPR) repeat protein
MEEFGARSRAGVGSAVLSRFLASCACAFLARGQRGRAGEVLTELEEFASQNRYTRALNEARNVANLFDFLDGKIEDAAVVQVTTIKNGENRYEILPTFAILMGDLDLAAESMDRPAQTADDHPMVKACHGIFHAVAGNADTAAGLLKELIEIAPPGNEDDLTNQAGCLLLELALAVDDRPVTERFYRALKGSDGERSLAGPNAWICRPRLLGDAAVRLGHQSEARAHYEEAWQFCESIRHRPELALSRLGLAEVLLEHYPDERAAAIKHLDFAIAEFRDMKMQPALERALGHRGLLKA